MGCAQQCKMAITKCLPIMEPGIVWKLWYIRKGGCHYTLVWFPHSLGQVCRTVSFAQFAHSGHWCSGKCFLHNMIHWRVLLARILYGSCEIWVNSGCVTGGVSWGLYFMIYNGAKSRWLDGSDKKELSAAQHLICGYEAGFVVSPSLSLLWSSSLFGATRILLLLGWPMQVSNAKIG